MSLPVRPVMYASIRERSVLQSSSGELMHYEVSYALCIFDFDVTKKSPKKARRETGVYSKVTFKSVLEMRVWINAIFETGCIDDVYDEWYALTTKICSQPTYYSVETSVNPEYRNTVFGENGGRQFELL